MQLALQGSLGRNFLPGGLPRINWTDPLTEGLVGCYVGGGTGVALIPNLVGLGSDLNTVGTGAAGFKTLGTGEGLGFNVALANNGIYGATSPSQQISSNISIYWRGLNDGVAGSADNNVLIGCGGTTAASFNWGIVRQGQSTNGQTVGLGAPTFAVPVTANILSNLSPGMASIGVTIPIGGTGIIYNNGANVASGAVAATVPPYTSSPITSMGCVGFGTGRHSGCTHLLGLIWNRILSPVEMLAIHLQPYRFLVYPDDDIMAMLVGVAAGGDATVNLTGAAMTASAGSFTPTVNPGFTGAAGTGSAGTFTPTDNPGFTGVAGTSAAGAFGIIIDGSPTLVGAAMTSAAGGFTPTTGTTFTLAGAAMVSAAGDFSVTFPIQNLTLVGATMSSAAGTFTVQSSAGGATIQLLMLIGVGT